MQGKARIIQPVFVASIMAFLMTAVVTFINLGLPADFLKRWAIAFMIAWPISVGAAFIAIPVAGKATKRVIACLEGWNKPC
jgi:hypothetical protein